MSIWYSRFKLRKRKTAQYQKYGVEMLCCKSKELLYLSYLSDTSLKLWKPNLTAQYQNEVVEMEYCKNKELFSSWYLFETPNLNLEYGNQTAQYQKYGVEMECYKSKELFCLSIIWDFIETLKTPFDSTV